jgi:hypothetical protein
MDIKTLQELIKQKDILEAEIQGPKLSCSIEILTHYVFHQKNNKKDLIFCIVL